MFTITKEFTFCASHRIEGHPKCGRMHGHNYKVIVSIKGDLDDRGMVIDYGVVSTRVKPIIEPYDHRYLVSSSNIKAQCPYYLAAMASDHKDDVYYTHTQHSTAEELARVIHSRVCAVMELPSENVRIMVQETEATSAFYAG